MLGSGAAFCQPVNRNPQRRGPARIRFERGQYVEKRSKGGDPMPGKRVTLADVARRAGLSPTAASMILNGRPDTRLSQEAHDRVNAAAAELGYRPNIAARGLSTG